MENKNRKTHLVRVCLAGILFLGLVSVLVTGAAVAGQGFVPATYGLLVLIACCGSMPYLY